MQHPDFPSAEYGLISRMESILAEQHSDYYLQGIGDDAAVRSDPDANKIIITADLSVENVHFSRVYMSMQEIGYRAMVSNISDCAAMGAIPDSALVQLVIPKGEDGRTERIEELYRGFNEACLKWRFPIVGGDCSRGEQWIIAITLLGRVPPRQRVLYRKGVCPGDRLWVTGVPGRSAAGHCVLRQWGREALPERYRIFADAHIKPMPRIEAERYLAAETSVHAVMDLSDGLSKDCRTLAYENGCGIILRSNPSHVPQAMVQLSREIARPWEEWFFHGGEDYELLFAAAADFDPSGCARALDGEVPLCIGECTADAPGIMVDRDGTLAPLPAGGYDHWDEHLQ